MSRQESNHKMYRFIRISTDEDLYEVCDREVKRRLESGELDDVLLEEDLYFSEDEDEEDDTDQDIPEATPNVTLLPNIPESTLCHEEEVYHYEPFLPTITEQSSEERIRQLENEKDALLRQQHELFAASEKVTAQFDSEKKQWFLLVEEAIRSKTELAQRLHESEEKVKSLTEKNVKAQELESSRKAASGECQKWKTKANLEARNAQKLTEEIKTLQAKLTNTEAQNSALAKALGDKDMTYQAQIKDLKDQLICALTDRVRAMEAETARAATPEKKAVCNSPPVCSTPRIRRTPTKSRIQPFNVAALPNVNVDRGCDGPSRRQVSLGTPKSKVFVNSSYSAKKRNVKV